MLSTLKRSEDMKTYNYRIATVGCSRRDLSDPYLVGYICTMIVDKIRLATNVLR